MLWTTICTRVDGRAFVQHGGKHGYSATMHRYGGAAHVLCTTVNTTSSPSRRPTRPGRGVELEPESFESNPKAEGRRGASYTGGHDARK